MDGLRRPPGERISGFFSYTLAFADIDDVGGLPYTPNWDVRHVLNLVLTWNLGAGFTVGGRLHGRSGKATVYDYLEIAFEDGMPVPGMVRYGMPSPSTSL